MIKSINRNQASQKLSKIQPFHDFKTKIGRNIKNVLQKKLKFRAAKLFKEDSLEELIKGIRESKDIFSPRDPVTKTNGQINRKFYIGMQTLISSKESFDF